MSFTVTYDPEADALYVRSGSGQRARTIEVDDRHYADVDADGRLVGLEILYPAFPMRLAELAQRFALTEEELVSAVAGAVPNAVTETGGTITASVVSSYTAVEGTIGADMLTVSATSGAAPEHAIQHA